MGKAVSYFTLPSKRFIMHISIFKTWRRSAINSSFNFTWAASKYIWPENFFFPPYIKLLTLRYILGTTSGKWILCLEKRSSPGLMRDRHQMRSAFLLSSCSWSFQRTRGQISWQNTRGWYGREKTQIINEQVRTHSRNNSAGIS